MNLQPTLKDDLILLRPLREDDFKPLYQIAKDPLIWEQHPCNNRYIKETTFIGTPYRIKNASTMNRIDKVDIIITEAWKSNKLAMST